MKHIIYADENYSTTRLLVKEKPELINNLDDKFESVLFLLEGENRNGEGGLRTKGYFKKSYNNKPLISIITVVFNGEKHLEETIQSVIKQTYGNVEYIIVDGGSMDGTMDIIKKYEDKIDYWVSEKDRGISDAFNKGIACALGELIGIINADDYYNLNCIDTVCFNYKRNIDMYYGSIVRLKEDGTEMFFTSNDESLKNLEHCSMQYIYHPTFFIKKAYYKQYGNYSIDYKIAMDYEFLTRNKLSNIKCEFIDFYITTMRYGGISDKFYHQAKLEAIKIYKIRYGKHFDKNILISYYLAVKAYIRQMLEKSRLEVLVDIKRKLFK